MEQENNMTREEAADVLSDMIYGLYPDDDITVDEEKIGAVRLAIAALRGPEWVRTVDRLPTAEDAGIDGMVAFCYRDNWDCFNRLEKWSDISPQKYTYWHRMLKAPRSEE
jgi:hypothetical protein